MTDARRRAGPTPGLPPRGSAAILGYDHPASNFDTGTNR
jgi:hypothetical protein